MTGKDYLVPVLNLFPIWRYGPITDFDGRYVRDGWYPDRFSTRRFKTEAAAVQFWNASNGHASTTDES